MLSSATDAARRLIANHGNSITNALWWANEYAATACAEKREDDQLYWKEVVGVLMQLKKEGGK
jgi:hypothetical protein